MLHPNPLSDTPEPGQSALRRRLEVIIFGTGSVAGRRFDITLITLILLSVSIVILDSVDELHNHLGSHFLDARARFNRAIHTGVRDPYLEHP